MKETPCFLLEETPRVRQYLRRYSVSKNGCGGGYHHNRTLFSEVDRSEHILTREAHERERESLHWPPRCSRCAYTFRDEDAWQIFVVPLYQRVDTGQIMTLAEAPPGAMWYAYWLTQYDGKPHLTVRCPDGKNWDLDSRGSEDEGWVWQGEAPKVTAVPSIDTGRWRGWLKDGVLLEA